MKKRKNDRFFVIVFRIGGETLHDFGWAPGKEKFLANIHYRVENHKKYGWIRWISNTFYAYKIQDITEYAKLDASGKRKISPENKKAIAEVIRSLKRQI